MPKEIGRDGKIQILETFMTPMVLGLDGIQTGNPTFRTAVVRAQVVEAPPEAMDGCRVVQCQQHGEAISKALLTAMVEARLCSDGKHSEENTEIDCLEILRRTIMTSDATGTTAPLRCLYAKRLREAVKFSAVLAALFLIAACYCLHWAYSRGAFEAASVKHPVNLKAGSSIQLHFSVPKRGDHELKIWYSRNASDDVGKDLDKIFGKATLRVGNALVEEVPLPVSHQASTRDGSAMVLSTGPMDPRNDYSLLLQIDGIPPSLSQSQAMVKVELAPYYHLLFLELEVMAALSFLAALSCTFLSVRWWRATSQEGNTKSR